jgi:hypothetical protein
MLDSVQHHIQNDSEMKPLLTVERPNECELEDKLVPPESVEGVCPGELGRMGWIERPPKDLNISSTSKLGVMGL